MKKIPRYINEHDKVAVIVSTGYGAGWSTWQTKNAEFLMFDKKLVELVIDNNLAEIPKYLASNSITLPSSELDQLDVQYVNINSYVVLACTDGYERLNEYDSDINLECYYKVHN